MCMMWYHIALTWIVLSVMFYVSGVWAFRVQHRYFPLRWYEVAYIMALAVLAWWLIIDAQGFALLLHQ